MLPISIVEAKGIYGFKKELGTTEARFRGRRKDGNTTAKPELLIVRDREMRNQGRMILHLPCTFSRGIC